MDEYREPYQILWRGVTKAVKMLDEGVPEAAHRELLLAQFEAEEAYISRDEPQA